MSDDKIPNEDGEVDISMTAESLIAHMGIRLSALQEMTFLPDDVPEVDPIGYRTLILAKIFLSTKGYPIPEEIEKWLGKISEQSIH